jgi:DNA polymerase III delta subunit
LNNICIFAGEEDYLKDMQVFKLCSRYRNSNKKTFYIESYRSDNLSEEFREIETFLSTYDFFSSFKIVKIILFKPEQVQYILNNIKGLSDESLLIIDIKCPEYLLKNTEFKYCGEKINIEVFREFKDYEKDKVFKNIRNAFIMEGIVFESKEDEEHALEYLFNTAQNSYSFIYKEIKKLKLLGKSPVSLNDLLNITTVFSNKNFYRACSKIFESSNDGELVEVLENYLPETSVKTLSAFIYLQVK